ncbi:MAG: hypothetical protein J0I99_00690 [Devosia sp.]|uniref:hypothetical protein n=1 Tax=Devosia sp. TaxID=1871048 RepID=UPI001AC959C6|nr:hypothetical protein [Devosia sp.]MBN9314234.1 hypothetical protein [Devosia sp.]
MAAAPKTTKPRPRETKQAERLSEFVNQKDLAKALSLSDRRVQILLKEGVLVARSRSSYPLVENYARYVAFKEKAAAEKAAPAAADGLRTKREEQLAIRIGREDRQLITLTEAMEFVDNICGRFLQTISGLPARHTRDLAERKRLEATCDDVRQELSDDFGKEQRALRTGVPVAEAADEDDA